MSGETPGRFTGLVRPDGELCLLTGASGFIGGHMAKRLVQDGYRVRCLVREHSETSALEGLGVELVVGDLTSLSSLIEAADGCRRVVHCAALVSDWATVEEIKKVNVEGTSKVLQASVAADVERFVHMSSTDVYGYPGGRGIDEGRTSARFRNWYSATKLAAETEVRRFETTRGLEAVILRPATIYGPGSEDVVGEIARAIRSEHMLLVGGGRAIAGLTYVENVVDAAVIALRHRQAPGKAFNVSDGLDITWRRFLGDIAGALGYPPPKWSLPYGVAYPLAFSLEHGYRLLRRTTGLTVSPLLSRQAVHVLGRDQDFSNRSAREVLGWSPRFSYEAGLAATVAWLKEALG